MVTTVGKEYDSWYGVASEDLEGLVGRSTEDVFATAAEAVGGSSGSDEILAEGQILASLRDGDVVFGTIYERGSQFIVCPRDARSGRAAGIGVLLYDTEYDVQPDELGDAEAAYYQLMLGELFRLVFDPETTEAIVRTAKMRVTLVDEWDGE